MTNLSKSERPHSMDSGHHHPILVNIPLDILDPKDPGYIQRTNFQALQGCYLSGIPDDINQLQAFILRLGESISDKSSISELMDGLCVLTLAAAHLTQLLRARDSLPPDPEDAHILEMVCEQIRQNRNNGRTLN